ncbi:MAG TPA: hypothetical protein VLX12_06235 [Syntrophorhabdales bacterium]|nr:hypothetical protein [Syntrophorhabdales bacterium]
MDRTNVTLEMQLNECYKQASPWRQKMRTACPCLALLFVTRTFGCPWPVTHDPIF